MSTGTSHRGKILIVEDEGVVATDIERCLEDAGFDITGIATSMNGAIQEASALRPDLILMDIRIKGDADGIQAADHMTRHFDLPVVYLTAHDDADTLERAKRTGPMAFLLKPFKSAELTSTVEIALQRSRLEKEVRERERSFLSAMDSIGDGVLTADSEGRVRFINRAGEELTGWPQELALGKAVPDILQIVPEASHEGVALHSVVAPESDFNNEYQVLSRSGAHRWLAIKTTTMDGTDGNSIHITVMRDVTQRKQSERALRRQADLLNQSHDPIFTWDVNGTIDFWNGGAEALYGYTAQDTLGRVVGDLLHTVGSSTGDSWQADLKRDGRWSGELTRKTKDGREIVVEAMLVVVREGSHETVLETDRDITGRKAAEIEIRGLNVKLAARVDELSTINRELESFSYSISHDLRAPLRHINGFAKILLEKSDLCRLEDARDHVECIHQAAQKMGQMVDALLELSRTSRRELVRRPTELKPLVAEVVDELKMEARDRQIDWQIGELPVIDSDPRLIRLVFANLIANAIKFTRFREAAKIEVGRTVLEGQTVLFVRDNGAGFRMKYADKLFGVFQRLHSDQDFEGTGIGLATVQRIISRHGGRIWAEAEPDQGAAFYFTLAAPEPPREQPERQIHETEDGNDSAG